MDFTDDSFAGAYTLSAMERIMNDRFKIYDKRIAELEAENKELIKHGYELCGEISGLEAERDEMKTINDGWLNRIEELCNSITNLRTINRELVEYLELYHKMHYKTCAGCSVTEAIAKAKEAQNDR